MLFFLSSRPLLPSYLMILLVLLIICTQHTDLASNATSIPTKIGKGYRLISIEESPTGGLLGHLQVKQKTNIYGPDIPLLQLYVKHETENRLRVHITDAKKQRWEVPYNLLPRERPPSLKQTFGKSRKGVEYAEKELIFTYTSDPFSFSVKRKSNGETLFDTSSEDSDPYSDLVFKDQYLEISTKLPRDAYLYGFGENTQPHGIRLFPNDPHTLYTTDISANNLNSDLYGSHPMYMDLRNVEGEASAHAVLLLNSNGMDVFYRGDSLTYRVIGGVFDFYFFSGPSPLAVVDEYTSLIGRPASMPYWAFGFHQCKWGYHNLSLLEDVVENYNKAKIPLDVIWNDADHMDGHKDFTLNPTNYPHSKLLAFLEKIHAQGMKYIVIVDPGISVDDSYDVYRRGVANDVFIKYEGTPYIAQVWPGIVNFPDFLNPKTIEWWEGEIRRFHALVPIDGLWIDMNEISNFCTGSCTLPEGKICPNQTGPTVVCCLDCKNITKTRWDDPPYKINASGKQLALGHRTIATSAYHHNGVLEYDAHSIYGFSEAVATHESLKILKGNRPFVLSRSTFVGSGKYAAHWTGDISASWDDLKHSISTILNFGIFGVPMVGSDICGFFGGTTEELCSRWIELGAFYPFSRNHADYYAPRQELYQWESVAKSARIALGMRYKLLPYLYTLSYEAHTTGAPIARPLFFTFTNETIVYGLSTQFLLGSSLMVSPVLDQNRTEVKAFFPSGSWYNIFNMDRVIHSKQSHYLMLNAPLHVINVHLYQNAIIPMQQGGLVSKEARTTHFTLVVSFPLGTNLGEAKGSLFLDDDELPDMKLESCCSTYVDFYATVRDGTVKVWSNIRGSEFALEKGWIIEKVTVLGLHGIESAFFEADINGSAVDISKVEIGIREHVYPQKGLEEGGDDNKIKNVMVEIKGLELPVGKKFALSWKMTK